MAKPGKKLLLLDRDGILIREHGGYTWQKEQVEFLEPTGHFLAALAPRYHFIVATNQSGIAKGLYTRAQAEALHGYIADWYQERFGVAFTAWFYCPHHPDIGLCFCRKPDSLMLERAVWHTKERQDDVYFIGDNKRDADAAEKAGIRALLVPANADLRPYLGLF